MKKIISYTLSNREYKAEEGIQYYLKPTGILATKNINNATILNFQSEVEEALKSIDDLIKNHNFDITDVKIIDLENL